jgi:phage terminase large subunit-like protein
MPREVWLANAEEPDFSVFDGAQVFGGLDLSARQDMTAVVWVASEGAGEPVHIWPESSFLFSLQPGCRVACGRPARRLPRHDDGW